jgi:hypothetical protein
VSPQELMGDLELSSADEVFVRFNGRDHPVQEVRDTSQGVILVVDTDQELRETM